MTDLLRQKLCDILTAHGPAVADDPRRCAELLRQAVPEDGEGVAALLRALEARVPARLALLTEPLALAPLTSGLVRRLVDEQGLSEAAARWAVESWAVALGKGDTAAPAFASRLSGYEHVLAPPRRRGRWPWLLLPAAAALAAVAGWWWLGQRSEVRRISAHTDGIYCLVLSADGRSALVGCGDKSLRLWDVDTGAELKRFDGHQAPAASVALSPDGRLALSGGGQVLQQGGKLTAVDCVVRAWDVETGQSRPPFGAGFKLTDAALTALKGADLPEAVLAKLGPLKDRRFDTRDDFATELTRAFGKEELDRYQQGILAHASFGAGFKLTDAALTALKGAEVPEAVLTKLSPLKDRRFDTRDDFLAELTRALGKEELDRYQHGILAHIRRQAEAMIRQARELDRYQHGILAHASVEGYDGPAHHVDFSPDGRLALACMGWWEYKETEYVVKDRKAVPTDCVVRLYDAATGQQVRKLEGHKEPVWCAAFTRDGRRVVSGAADGTIRLWDAAGGRELRRVELTGKPRVICLAVSPDGRRLLTGDDQSQVRLWNLEELEQLEEQPRSEPVRSVAFSPDGQRALSGGDDHMVRLWAVEGLNELRHFPGHSKPVTGVAFLPDGRHALSGSGDGTIRVWRLPP
jgi:WD40 repeat protein